MEPHEQQVEIGVVAGGSHCVHGLSQLGVIQGPTPTLDATGLVEGRGRVADDEPSPLGPAEQGTQGLDAVLP
jgi:hypothetical protein